MISRNRHERKTERLKKFPRALQFSRATAVREVAGDHHDLGVKPRDQLAKRLERHGRCGVTQMEIRDVKNPSGHSRGWRSVEGGPERRTVKFRSRKLAIKQSCG